MLLYHETKGACHLLTPFSLFYHITEITPEYSCHTFTIFNQSAIVECLQWRMLMLVNLPLKMLGALALTVGSLVKDSLPSGSCEFNPKGFCRTEAQAVLNVHSL